MAIGDDAVAAGFVPAPGTVAANTIDTELGRLADWVANRTSDITPVDKGGTAATNATGARANLGIPAWDIYATPDTLIVRAADGLFAVATALYPSNPVPLQQLVDLLAAKADTSALAGKADVGSVVSKGGDTMSGQLYLPASSAATSGYTSAYINGDGRVSRGASARKYKKYISDVDPLDLGDIFPQLVRYQMRNGDGDWKLGHIADDLNGDAARFAVILDGEVESIDFIQLLLAQTAQLHAALDLAIQRIENLEQR